MSTWIELHADVFEHRKVVSAANALTRGDREKLVGHLARLWTWCIDHAESGDLSHLSDRDVAHAAGWRGRADRFVAALADANLLDPGPKVHDWEGYAGRLIERRRRDRERKRADYVTRVSRPKGSMGGSVGGAVESPAETMRDIRAYRTVPNRTGPNRKYLPASQIEAVAARAGRSTSYDPPMKSADGRLVDSRGQEWPSMNHWAASIRDRKTAHGAAGR